MTVSSTSTRVHHNTIKAAKRAELAYHRNIVLHAMLNEFGAICVRSASTRFNKYTLYFYMLQDRPALDKRNSPARAFATRKIWGKYRDVAFISEVSLIEQENYMIEDILLTHFKYIA